METRKPYPSDVNNEECAFVPRNLTLMREGTSQRTNDLREIFSASRWIVRTELPAGPYR